MTRDFAPASAASLASFRQICRWLKCTPSKLPIVTNDERKSLVMSSVDLNTIIILISLPDPKSISFET